MKELVKIINKAGKMKQLLWLHDENFDYIQTGDLVFRTEILGADELGAVISFFGKFPEIKQALCQSDLDTADDENKATHQFVMSETVRGLFVNDEDGHSFLKKTDLVQLFDSKMYRIFTSINEYKFIPDEYMCLLSLSYDSAVLVRNNIAKVVIDDNNVRNIEVLFLMKNFDEIQSEFLKELEE